MVTKKTKQETKKEVKQEGAGEGWLKPPKKTCTDVKCPFHGTLRVHGRMFVGKVIKPIFHKTATIEFQRQLYLKKYERYEKRRSKIKAHVPPCLDVVQNSMIRIAETRPMSKTKNFVAIEVINNESN